MSKKTRIEKTDQVTLAERANRYLNESSKILKKYGLLLQLTVNFPRRFRTPILSRIALWIVSKQGGYLDIRFRDMRKQ
jgi:hypothetical protein